MHRNSEFTGEFTYEIDNCSDDDYTEDYGEHNKRTSGFHKRYPFLARPSSLDVLTPHLSFIFKEYQT